MSAEYAKKLWTTHEKKSALARALEERSEYILPVRFDDTEIPGIRPTIGYIDARRTSTEELAKIIKLKVSGKESHIVKSVATYTDHGLNFEIPNGWAISDDKQINSIQMDGTSISDTQIILTEGPSVIRVDIIEIPQIKWLLNMYDDCPWYVTGVLESFYRNNIIRVSIPESQSGGSGIPVNPDGTKDMSFRTSSNGDKTEWIIAWVKPEYADKFIAVHALFQGDQSMKSLSMSGGGQNYYMQEPLYEVLTSLATQFGNIRK